MANQGGSCENQDSPRVEEVRKLSHERWLIGDLAKQTGVTAKAIRHYESLGLLDAAPRTESGYRTYSAADVERVRFIQSAKVLGLTLSEIQDVITGWAAGQEPCAKVSALIDRKIEELDRKMAQMARFREELAAYKARKDASGPPKDSGCRHIAGVSAGEWSPSVSPPDERPAAGTCASDRNVGPLRLVKGG